MQKIIYLMHPITGFVDTRENWLLDMQNWEPDEVDENNPSAQEQFDRLVEVEKDENGEWQKA